MQMHLIIGSLLFIFLIFFIRKIIALAIFLLLFVMIWVDFSKNTESIKTPTQIESNIKVLTYNELHNYPVDCKKKKEQLSELYALQKYLNFNIDPDKLNNDDSIYDARLKATIWYFYYGCEE